MPTPAQFYETLHVSPTVVWAKVAWLDYFAVRLRTAEPLAVLTGTNWVLSPGERASAMRWALGLKKTHPQHHIEFMLDRADEFRLFEQEGLKCTLFNPNALCDERIYRPLDVDQIYDAVYIARPTPCKRLHLCRGLSGPWLWLTYNVDEGPEIVRTAINLPNIVAPQFQGGKFTGYIERWKIPEYLAKAKVGLCLSNVEGSNYASAEYLLCGLPVVATPGHCTRGDFFDDRHVIVADPKPEAINAAVKELIRRRLDPQEIREAVLEKMVVHRRRFVDACRRAYQAVGIQHDPAFDLTHLWRHQMLFWQPVANVHEGGGQENQNLLRVAAEEPRIRKLWGGLSPRFWEQPLP